MKYTRMLPADVVRKKQRGESITMVATYDAWSAQLVDEAGIDMILVGDSAANVIAGYTTTLPMTMDIMIYHSQSVVAGSSRCMVVGDMPFMSYQNAEMAKTNAGRFLKEGGTTAIKLEILPSQVDILAAVTAIGIPVLGHIGFTPQTLFQLGGYKVQGKDTVQKQAMVELAKSIEHAGAFGIVLEMVPSDVSEMIRQAVAIPTIGIGAGSHCDGQVLVFHDLVGITEKSPKFVKRFGHVRVELLEALGHFKTDVSTGQFPGQEHTF